MSSNISKRLDAFKKVDEPKEEVDSAAMVKILDEKPSYNRYHVNPKIFSSRNISAPRPLRGTYVSNAKFTSIQSIPFDEPNKCICDRSDRPLICIRCKGTCYGRVSQKCPLHPNVSSYHQQQQNIKTKRSFTVLGIFLNGHDRML